MRDNYKKEIVGAFTVIFCAAISALGLHIFVYPSDFAPSGIDGVSTVLQEVTGINAGLFNFFINLPLLIAAWFVLKKRYVIYTVCYTLLTSAFLILLANVGAYQYISGADSVIPAIFGGIAQGLTGLMLRIGGSAGGVDVMACMIQKRIPHKNVENIISILSYSAVALSFFVYRNVNSVLLSVIEIFVCEKVTSAVLRTSRSAVEFKIVTDHPKDICEDIQHRLRRSATVLNVEGGFSKNEKSVILCVVSYRQIPDLLGIVDRHGSSFAYYSDVMGVRGEFDLK